MSNIIRVGEKRTQMSVSERRQSFTLTQNATWIFLLYSTPSTQETVNQPHYVEMFSQGVICSKKTSKYPELHPVSDRLTATICQNRRSVSGWKFCRMQYRRSGDLRRITKFDINICESL